MLSLSTKHILGFIIVVLFAIFYTLISNGHKPKDEQWDIFISLLTAVATPIFILSLYTSVQNKEDSDEKNAINETIKNVHDLWIEPNEYISNHFNDLGALPSELYPDLNIRNQQQMKQMVAASKLFQSIENYEMVSKQDKDIEPWLCCYLQWCQSPTLQQLWPKLKQNYKKSTIIFIEFLFLYADRLRDIRRSEQRSLIAKDYDLLVKKITPQAKRILESSAN